MGVGGCGWPVGVGAGLIDTATIAQFLAVKLHANVTLLPSDTAVLPAPVTVSDDAWYCCVCPGPVTTSIVTGLAPTASRTTLPVVAETVTVAGVPLSPESFAATPRGAV